MSKKRRLNYKLQHDRAFLKSMNRQMLRIENLVNVGEEEEYLLAEEDDDNWGDLDETQPPETQVPECLEHERQQRNDLLPHKQQPVSAQQPTQQNSQVQPAQDVDTVEPAKTSKKKKKKGCRGRTINTWNYTVHDVNVLLDIIEEHEPTGMNGWALVYRDYNRYAQDNDRPRRRSVALKKKYDKLLYFQKRTGDPTCPEYVRRAKNIQKEILSKMVSLSYNSNLEDHIGLSAKENESVAGPSGQQNQAGSRNNNVSQNQQKRMVSRPYITPAKRRETELQDTMKDLGRSLRDFQDAQTSRMRQQMAAADRDMESLVKEVVERSRQSIQAMELSHSLRSPSRPCCIAGERQQHVVLAVDVDAGVVMDLREREGLLLGAQNVVHARQLQADGQVLRHGGAWGVVAVGIVHRAVGAALFEGGTSAFCDKALPRMAMCSARAMAERRVPFGSCPAGAKSAWLRTLLCGPSDATRRPPPFLARVFPASYATGAAA
ncbi:hypothetical protein FGB62_6g240 [Gracilaria domingensis]|nr:hypothetical protein FGB62_6g240 [Gracilaria domingensis]